MVVGTATATTHVALVTGGSGGIGRVAAERLARDDGTAVHYAGNEARADEAIISAVTVPGREDGLGDSATIPPGGPHRGDPGGPSAISNGPEEALRDGDVFVRDKAAEEGLDLEAFFAPGGPDQKEAA